MALYEHIFMARQDVSSQQVDTLVEHFKSVLESNGGSVAKIENWGLKTLPYRVKKNRKAHYSLLQVDGPAAAIHEIERQLLHESLVHCNGVTLRAAEFLGINRNTLNKKVKDLGVSVS